MSNTMVKVALVTGAARRIGAEIAAVLHNAGMNIILHYHTSLQEADALCFKLNEKRPQSAMILRADLRDILSMENLVDQAVGAWGRLDVLVNNASQFYKTLLGETTEFTWDDLLTTNLKSPFFLSQAAAVHLRKNQGVIINIADIHGERPMGDYAVYCISKAGLIMMTKALAKELGPDVRVNAVSPGAIIWPEKDNELSADLKTEIVSRTVLKRSGESREIADIVAFLVKQGNYITGQVIAVDGGRSLYI